jgi:hypothetical protein
MKKLLFALLFLPFLSLAQSTAIKGANTVIIQPTDTTAIMKKLVGVLARNGYTIANANTDLGILNTNPKKIKTVDLVLNAVILENKKIVLSGVFSAHYYSSSYAAENRGMKNSDVLNSWRELVTTAQQFPEAVVNYEKR